MSRIKLTWNQYNSKLQNFATLLKNDEFDYIIPIARGGWVPALIISHELDVRGVFSFGTMSYDDKSDERLTKTVICQIPSPKELKGKRVLIVDDIVDTGRTMSTVTGWLTKHKVKYKTAALFKKKGALFVPDYYWEENKQWIQLPYE